MRELIATVERVTGRRVATREAGRRPGDAPALFAAARRASALLGRPVHSSLDNIVATAAAWASAFRNQRSAVVR